jgi:hypothetical protein
MRKKTSWTKPSGAPVSAIGTIDILLEWMVSNWPISDPYYIFWKINKSATITQQIEDS